MSKISTHDTPPQAANCDVVIRKLVLLVLTTVVCTIFIGVQLLWTCVYFKLNKLEFRRGVVGRKYISKVITTVIISNLCLAGRQASRQGPRKKFCKMELDNF